jgi:hypothetical protein
MIEYIRARLREKSTWAGLVAIALALALLIVPVHFEGDVAAQLTANIQWLISALFVGGLGGVVWHRNV